ncbi:hypothetical protein CF98_34090 [Halopseudomonas bauzanensis]|nr:hypothetical protein CF98_34090 [Halopseudomonas bauzanensis]
MRSPATVLAEVLGHRDKFDASLAQSANVKFRMQTVATEAGQRMNDDKVEGTLGSHGFADHFLKRGPVVIKG